MIGIVIVARLGSTRLKKKHLISVGDFTFIELLILRINHYFKELILENKAKIVIATADEPENRIFNHKAKVLNYEVFFGDSINIPNRQLQCSEFYEFDAIISVDGDDIFCSVESMLKIYDLLKINKFELIKTTGLPLGMNVMGYNIRVLKEALNNYSGPEILETGWGKIFNFCNQLNYTYTQFGNIDDLRMTLDYDLDAIFFKKIVENLNVDAISISDIDLVEFIKKNQYQNINNELNKEYWFNFNKQI